MPFDKSIPSQIKPWTREDFIHKFGQTLKDMKVINQSSPYLVGFSGGADSVSLVLALVESQMIPKKHLYLVYINHGVRESSVLQREEEWVRSFAEKYGLDLQIVKISPQKSDEKTLRDLRLGALEKLAKNRQARGIFLGHHWDDHLETLLQQAIRNAGPFGLQGIRPQRGLYLRPLLDFSKSDLLEYLKENNQEYLSDESNQDTRYQRNFIRKFKKELEPAQVLNWGAFGILGAWMQNWRDSLIDQLKMLVFHQGQAIKLDRMEAMSLPRVVYSQLISLSANRLGLPGPFPRGFLMELWKQILQKNRGKLQSQGLMIHWNSQWIFLGSHVVKHCNFGYFIKVKQSSELEKIPSYYQLAGGLQVQLESLVRKGESLLIRTLLSSDSGDLKITGYKSLTGWYQDQQVPATLRKSFLGIFSRGIFLGLFSPEADYYHFWDNPI